MLEERVRAVQVGRRKICLRFGAREIGLGLIECGTKRPLVEREQEIARLHELAVGEVHLLEITGDARTNLDCIHGDEAAYVFVAIDELLANRIGDGHLRRRRCRRRALAAAGEQKGQRNCGAEGRGRAMHGLSLAMAGLGVSYTPGTG